MKFLYKSREMKTLVNADGEIKEKLTTVLLVSEFEDVDIKLSIKGDPELVDSILVDNFRVRNVKDLSNAKFTKAKQQKSLDESLPKSDGSVLEGDLDNAVDELSSGSSDANFPDLEKATNIPD